MAKSKEESFWDIPMLAPEDQKIVDAYREVGKPLDQLPYSKSFKELIRFMGEEPTDEKMFLVFQRLITLRKQGRLPMLRQFAEVF
jgi:hypothetical protein